MRNLEKISLLEDEARWFVERFWKAHREQRKAHERELRRLQNQYRLVYRQLNILYDDRAAGLVPDDVFSQRQGELTSQLELIRMRLKGIEVSTNVTAEKIELVARALTDLPSAFGRLEPMKQIELLLNIQERSVLKDRKLEFNFLEPFDMIAEFNQAYPPDSSKNADRKAGSKSGDVPSGALFETKFELGEPAGKSLARIERLIELLAV